MEPYFFSFNFSLSIFKLLVAWPIELNFIWLYWMFPKLLFIDCFRLFNDFLRLLVVDVELHTLRFPLLTEPFLLDLFYWEITIISIMLSSWMFNSKFFECCWSMELSVGLKFFPVFIILDSGAWADEATAWWYVIFKFYACSISIWFWFGGTSSDYVYYSRLRWF